MVQNQNLDVEGGIIVNASAFEVSIDGITLVRNAQNQIEINLANPNVWTAAQTFGNIEIDNGSINTDTHAPLYFQSNNAYFDGGGHLGLKGYITLIDNISTVGFGVGAVFGIDNRTGITAADSAAITLYTTPGPGGLFKVAARILATAGTSPTASYVLTWTEGGAAISKTLSISAIDTDAEFNSLIQPDTSTAITVQLKTISGTSTAVNVAASVERIA